MVPLLHLTQIPTLPPEGPEYLHWIEEPKGYREDEFLFWKAAVRV